MRGLCLIFAATISETQMATDVRSTVGYVAVALLLVYALYLINPSLFRFGSREGFQATLSSNANYKEVAGQNDMPGAKQRKDVVTNPHSTGGDATAVPVNTGSAMPKPGMDASGAEGFADLAEVSGPANFGSAEGPAGCYPRDQLTPGELLPKDPNSVWAQQNPMGTGSLKGKNFLSAGALIGVNTVGQSLRNANWQLRSEPPNPQVPVSVFNNTTIEPDTNRRDLEVD
jgi:hypothetical protein